MSSTEFNMSLSAIEREIRLQARVDADLKAQARDGADRVKDKAVEFSPIGNEADGDDHPGAYAGAWHVRESRNTGEGLPSHKVVNNNPNAEKVEYGTGQNAPRGQGGSSPEHAVAARTAAFFGGTESTIDLRT